MAGRADPPAPVPPAWRFGREPVSVPRLIGGGGRPGGAGGLFPFRVKGGYEAYGKLVNGLQLFSHVANLGETRSLVIHSASTTHRQLSPEQQVAAGAAPNVVRLSIGIEDADDLIADLDQALAKATA